MCLIWIYLFSLNETPSNYEYMQTLLILKGLTAGHQMSSTSV